MLPLPLAARAVSTSLKFVPDSPSVSVVVPCYNEESRLDGRQFLEFLNGFPRLRFVFVDDGSSDGTLGVLDGLQSANPSQIEVLRLEQNAGKAEAVRQGLLHAIENGSDLVGYWDADLATPLSAISDFAAIAERYSEVAVVYGARMQLLGHRINRTVGRRIVSRICSTLARMAVRLPVCDTQCGAKLLRNTPAVRESLSQPFCAGWLFDVEFFARMSAAVPDRHSAFYEFPLSEWTEVAGSKIDGRIILRSGMRMLRLVAEMRLGRVVG
jgi:glycosyltransferase involved in cell wall biosynthesis